MTPQSSPTRVLVVDDDPMSRELLSLLLEGEGFTVDSAESGEAALILLRQARSAPSLVLTDVQMPGLTGAQLARKLRRACGPATLLLAMSGSQPPAGAISLFDGFLMKPFHADTVVSALRTHNSAAQKASNKRMSVELQEQEKTMQTHKPHAAQPPPITDSAPVLNETIYQQLAGSMPAPQLQEMYALCINDARRRIAGMRRFATDPDDAPLTREAHAIKGGAGMLGATELHRKASELEAHGLNADRQTVAQKVNSLDELSAACDRLERILRSRV